MADLLCAVCCENFSGIETILYPYLLPCHHIYHIGCIKATSEACGHSCPLCRRAYSNMVDEAKKYDLLAMRIEKEKKNGIKEEDKEFIIFVKDLTSKSFKINVRYDYTEAKIYELVAALSGIPNGEFRLVTGTKNLVKDGQRILFDLDIGHLSNLHLLLRLKGGLN